MTSPTIPIPFLTEPSDTTAHFVFAEQVSVSSEVLNALVAVCPTSTAHGELLEAGRDWWPLGMKWARDGETAVLPGAVCTPRSTQEVVDVVVICHAHGIPVTPAGGRSGVCGASIPLYGGVVLNLTALDGVVSVDATSGVVEVLPGTFGPDLERAINASHQLTVGHYPQSFDISTVGGWIACRGAGQYSTRYGKIEDMVVGLEVVLADGTVVHTGGAPAGATGTDLTHVFLGSEGTLGIITRAWLRAHPLSDFRMTAAYRFATFNDGIEACRNIIRSAATPAVLRLYDGTESKRSHDGDGTMATLLVLDEGDPDIVESTMRVVAKNALKMGAIEADAVLVENWLAHRNNTSALQALITKGFVVDTIEVAAPWSALQGINTAVTEAIKGVNHARSASCHLSHSYLDGACLYFTFAASPPGDEYEQTYVQLWDAAQRGALAAGANISHHHGIGLNRSRFMSEALGNSFGVLQSIKTALDPKNILNPGKLGLTNSRGAAPWPPKQAST